MGISEQEQALHVRAYNEKIQPQTLRRLDLLKKALQIVDSVKPETLRSQFEGSMRSPFSRATNIRGISEKAQAALDAINAKGVTTMSSDSRYLDGRLQRPVVGSPEWERCFPSGVTRDSSKAPPIDYGPTGNPFINGGKSLPQDDTP